MWNDLGAIPPEVFLQETSRKQFLSKYCRQYVLPKIKTLEHSWFGEQLAKLNSDGLVPYADWAPLRQCWTAREQWTLWPTSLWHMHRIWCVARIIGGTPILSDKTNDFVTLFAECPSVSMPHGWAFTLCFHLPCYPRPSTLSLHDPNEFLATKPGTGLYRGRSR